MSRYLVPTVSGPLDVDVEVPGSKSLTIRALFTASLASGESTLIGPLQSEDTAAARGCLRAVGVGIEELDNEWRVRGTGGRLQPSSQPLDVGESGLTARSMIAIASLIEGSTRIVGRGRLPERPMGGLADALRPLGVEVSFESGGLPAVVVGTGTIIGGAVAVDVAVTTQYATAMLMMAPLAETPLTLGLVGLEGSAGYLDLTVDVMSHFGAEVERVSDIFRVSANGYRPARYSVEADASSAVYPMVAAAVLGGRVTIKSLGSGSNQPDFRVGEVLATMGCRVTSTTSETTVESEGGRLRPVAVDLADAPDGALAVAVACLFADGESRITGLGSLRHKESDRIAALAEQIENVGGGARVEGDTLRIVPGSLRPASIRTYGDHRVAMAFALVGLAQPGIEIEDPTVVDKTWPGYWDFIDSLRE